METIKNKEVKIIAGPCSISRDNFSELYKIAEIKINGQPAIWGVRVVGLKSRTKFDKRGIGMGIDFKAYSKNIDRIIKRKELKKLEFLPSVKLAQKIYADTGLLIATEIIDPLIQPIFYEGIIPENKLLLWNPAVHQLGWSIFLMAKFIKKNKWFLGLKNPKWLGDYIKRANDLNNETLTTAEKTWEGLKSYSNLENKRIIFIHRGFDIPEKKEYRNFPAHNLVTKIKKRLKCQMFFDPSHSFGPKMRDKIVKGTIDALKIKISEEEYLYDGVLIEVGNSQSDTGQHISIKELKNLCKEISKFRNLETR